MSDTRPGDKFLDLELRAEVWLAAEDVALEKLLELQPGGTLPLSRDPDGPVDLVVNGSVVASGELVVVDGKFGFRVTSSSDDEIEGLHGGEAAVVASEANAAPAEPAPGPPTDAAPGTDEPAGTAEEKEDES